MLSPEYIANLSEGAEEIASELHTNIIKRVVQHITERLGQGLDFSLSQSDRYQLEILQEAGFLMKDIIKEIAAKTKTQTKEVQAAFEDAGVRSMQTDEKTYEAAGIPTKPLTQSPNLIRVLQRGYEATLGEWANYTRTMALSAQQLFISECDHAYNRVVSGEVSFSEAFYDAIRKVSQDGIDVYYPKRDKDGKPIPDTVGWHDTIEVATARAVRTGIAQTTAAISATRAAESGVTCFLVSAHAGARPTHEAWQGQIYWIDWAELARRLPIPAMDRYPEATAEDKAAYKEFCTSTEIGEMLGLCGINCRHSYGPYFPGLSHNPYASIDFNEDPDLYAKTQRQRELERRIRKTKREIISLVEAKNDSRDELATSEFNRLISKKEKLLARQNEQYKKYCADNKLRPQEQRLAVAGWNRQVVKALEASSYSTYYLASDSSVARAPDEGPVVRDYIYEDSQGRATIDFERMRADYRDLVLPTLNEDVRDLYALANNSADMRLYTPETVKEYDPTIAIGYNVKNDTIDFNLLNTDTSRYNIGHVLTHEYAHQMDARMVQSWRIKDYSAVIEKEASRGLYLVEQYLANENQLDDHDGALLDIIDGITAGKYNELLPSGHSSDYWKSLSARAAEIFGEYMVLLAYNQTKRLAFLEENLPDLFEQLRGIKFEI